MNPSPSRRAAALALLGGCLAGAACGETEDPFAVSTADAVIEAPPARFTLDAAARARSSPRTAAAGPAVLARQLLLPGQVDFAADRHASVVARLDGVLTEVHVGLGDRVERGELLVALQSRELARTRSAVLETTHRLEFADASLEREQRLWEKRITSELSLLAARHEHEEARLDWLTARQELLAVAGPGGEPLLLQDDDDAHASLHDLTRFELRAPVGGVIVARHAVLGEAVAADAELFEIADLERVWVDLRVAAADLAELSVGHAVRVRSRELQREVEAALAYVDPRVDPHTQTGLARLVLPNPDGHWRPGLLVDVSAEVGRHAAAVSVPLAAVHRLASGDGRDDEARVFVDLGAGTWEARSVRLGRRDATHAEVLDGLAAGEQVAVGDGPLLAAWWLGQQGAAP